MKRLSTIMTCLLAMMAASMSAKAQEVTITLFPGWNWISYPKAETQDISTALGDFEPVNGDMLKSQFGNAVYSNGYWRGSVTHFIPGWGYKYYSNRTEVVSFVFGEEAPQLIVTTAEPTEITAISAISGGSLTSSDGSYIVVLEKGICWATHPNPTVMNDFHTENGSGINSFTSEMTDLNFNTIYYVRAYAVTDSGTTYGEEMSFTTPSGIPTFSTVDVTDVYEFSAIVGSAITDDGGSPVTDRGLCWGIHSDPTIDEMSMSLGSGLGNFSYRITGLNRSTTYYVRAYAINDNITAYSNQMVFSTLDGVDLGLPSGLLWASSNVGANCPEDFGDYFAWGETEPKDYYYWNTYHFCSSDYIQLTKYCNNAIYGLFGFTDTLTILLPEDDAASSNWGEGWRTPTDEEWEELYQNTTQIWATRNGVTGVLFTASNNNSIFLPAAGYRMFGNRASGETGTYWSSSLDTEGAYNSWGFYFDIDYYLGQGSRYLGKPVRPVRSTLQN